jgi:peptidoglycan/xylan/chitin deacetylase (PgdA/CDA1 family)
VVFLCYHGVTESGSRSPHNKKGLHVNRHRFSAHLDYLQHRYNVISLRDYLDARQTGHMLPDYSVVITFDDGFRNFLTAAAPCLAARSMPATVFLITDRAGEAYSTGSSRKWKLEDDTSYLSWEDALELKERQNIEFGSHTCSHPQLPTLSLEDIERELLDSYDALSAHLDIEQQTLAYPKGEHSEIIANCARKIGYCCAVTTDRGANELDHELFTLGRTLIGDFDDESSFAVRVSGLRWWLVKARSMLVPLTYRQRAIMPLPRHESAGNLQNNAEDQSTA